jgi:hypothetical protein
MLPERKRSHKPANPTANDQNILVHSGPPVFAG